MGSSEDSRSSSPTPRGSDGSSATSEKSRFLRPRGIPAAAFEESLRLAERGSSPSAHQRDTYVEYWQGEDDPWRWACRDKAPVDDERVVVAEEARKAAAEAEDAGCVDAAARLRGFGVSVEWLLAFSFAHDCWTWPTHRVVRDVVKPATASTRCRYAQRDACGPFVGSATVFVSHCWGARWGDTVLAVADCLRADNSEAALRETFVWIDVFAVRQWPGNGADLDFRGVVAGCAAVVVAMSREDCLARWELADAEDGAAKG